MMTAVWELVLTPCFPRNYSSVAQLDAGVRLLSAQVHNDNGVWSLCHSSCSLLNVGRLSDWLKGIKSWMDRNPHDGQLNSFSG